MSDKIFLTGLLTVELLKGDALMPYIPTREEAYKILTDYNKSEALIKHALAVESVMKHFARLLGEDEAKWGIIGLLHDVDYELYPEEHCKKVVEILEGLDFDGEYIRAIVSHGYGICSQVEPEHIMEKVLYTIDELTGLINAAALMRPSKSVLDMEYKSLAKKFKTPSFAGGVDRDVIQKGVVMLQKEHPEMDLKYIMEETILGMREAADAIGLRGDIVEG